MVVVRVKGETREVKKEECDQMNPPKYEKCTDMSNLTFLNEASVLYNLSARYGFYITFIFTFVFYENNLHRGSNLVWNFPKNYEELEIWNLSNKSLDQENHFNHQFGVEVG